MLFGIFFRLDIITPLQNHQRVKLPGKNCRQHRRNDVYHPLDVRFNFPPAEWSRLEQLATESELSYSSYIKKIIHDHLQEQHLAHARKIMRGADPHPAELFLRERCALQPDGHVGHQALWKACSLYYTEQYPELKPRFLGGRRKLFALVDEI